MVVIHEAFGLNDDVRAKADQFAAHGYLALAPDLYDGRPWIRCVLGAFRQLRAGSGPAFTVLEAARGFLAAQADCTGKTGVIGFCMGGAFALLCAPCGGFAAASVNYGEVPGTRRARCAGPARSSEATGVGTHGHQASGAAGGRAHRPGDPARRAGVPGPGTAS